MILLHLFDESQTRFSDFCYIPESKSKIREGLNEISLSLATMRKGYFIATTAAVEKIVLKAGTRPKINNQSPNTMRKVTDLQRFISLNEINRPRELANSIFI